MKNLPSGSLENRYANFMGVASRRFHYHENAATKPVTKETTIQRSWR
jgi:hypothetical protein